MRLGISHVLSHETPEQWAQDLRALGLSAAVFPVEYAAGDAQIAAYADAARGAGLCIAEVGAWSNPLSEIPEQRQAALEKCKGQLRLAEELGSALLRQHRRGVPRRALGRVPPRQLHAGGL